MFCDPLFQPEQIDFDQTVATTSYFSIAKDVSREFAEPLLAMSVEVEGVVVDSR